MYPGKALLIARRQDASNPQFRVKGMNELAQTFEQLSARIDALERRVRELEKPSAPPAHTPTLTEQTASMPMVTPDLPSGEQISSALLLLGKSILGIAGAYLLRALAESGTLPRPLLATLAIAYAIAWLVAASRTSIRMRLAPALYATTSVLILAPMLWELTMRFRVLNPVASAGVLALFVAASTVLNRKLDRPDFAVAWVAAALTALALSIATHEMMSYSGLLLAMFALCEYRSLHNARQSVRIWLAAVIDCMVWFLIVIYRNPPAARADYPPLGTAALSAPATLLLAITAGSVLYRTIPLKRRITALEAIQIIIAFLLWVLTALFLLPHFSPRAVGLICLLFAAACYGAAYGLFRHSTATRNFHTFAVWGAALFLAGIFLTLPSNWAPASLAAASVTSTFLAARICCATLECHGIIYLGVAAAASGLLEYTFRTLAGAMPATTAWIVFLVAGSALACFLAARESQSPRWQLKLLHLAPAVLAVGSIAALASHGSVRLASLVTELGAPHIAFIRTVVLCATALAVAFAGPRWGRPELKPIAYAVLAFSAAKLVFEDLRQGQLGFIAASMFLFALTLIGVPRLARRAESHSRP